MAGKTKAAIDERTNGASEKAIHADKVVFDLSSVTGRDVVAFGQGAENQFKLFARTIVDAPPWLPNPQDMDSYPDLPMRRIVALRKQFSAELEALRPVRIAGLAFDLDEITYREITEAAEKREIAQVMAKYATRVPEDWGAADDPETYLNLPGGVYLAAENAWLEAVRDLGKN